MSPVAAHPQPLHKGRSAAGLLLSCAVHGVLLLMLARYSLWPMDSAAMAGATPMAIQVVVLDASSPSPLPAAKARTLRSPSDKVQPTPTVADQAPLSPAPSVSPTPPTPAAMAQAQPALVPVLAATTATQEKTAEPPAIQNAHPDYAYNPPPDYPMALREQGLGGVVWLRVWVDSEGHPGEIKLSKGSGYRMLDEAALRAVRLWRFVPARSGDQRLASWVEFPVRFALNS